MSATLTSKFTLLISSILANTVGVAPVQANVELSNALALATGTGANQADKLYTAQITRTHASPDGDLDLAGVLTDPLGQTITMAKIRAILLIAAAANVNSVVVGGGATAPVTSIFFDYVATALAQPALKLKPGGVLFLTAPATAGYAVTATTADKLQISNGDEDATTSVTVDIYILGTSV